MKNIDASISQYGPLRTISMKKYFYRLLRYSAIIAIIIILVSLFWGKPQNNLLYAYPPMFFRFSEPFIEISGDKTFIYEQGSSARYILEMSSFSKYADSCSHVAGKTVFKVKNRYKNKPFLVKLSQTINWDIDFKSYECCYYLTLFPIWDEILPTMKIYASANLSHLIGFLLDTIYGGTAPVFYHNVTYELPDSIVCDLSSIDTSSGIILDHSHPENLSMILVPDLYWDCEDVIKHYPIRIQSDHIELEETGHYASGYPVWFSKDFSSEDFQLVLKADNKLSGRYLGRLVRKTSHSRQ